MNKFMKVIASNSYGNHNSPILLNLDAISYIEFQPKRDVDGEDTYYIHLHERNETIRVSRDECNRIIRALEIVG